MTKPDNDDDDRIDISKLSTAEIEALIAEGRGFFVFEFAPGVTLDEAEAVWLRLQGLLQ